MGFLQDLAAKRYISTIRRDYPIPWGLGIEQAETHFEEHYHSVPPKAMGGVRGLMSRANQEADSYIPSIVLQSGGEPDQNAVQAFCTAFERRLSELFLGMPKGKLLNR